MYKYYHNFRPPFKIYISLLTFYILANFIRGITNQWNLFNGVF